MTVLAKRLYELRKSRGLMQDELAEALGVSRQAVSKWEMGTGVPTLDNLISISKFFGVTIDSLVTDEPITTLTVAPQPESAAALPYPACPEPFPVEKTDWKHIAKVNILTYAVFNILLYLTVQIISAVSMYMGNELVARTNSVDAGNAVTHIARTLITVLSLLSTIAIIFMMTVFFDKGRTLFARGLFERSEPFMEQYRVWKMLISFGIMAVFDLILSAGAYVFAGRFLSEILILPRVILLYAVMSFGKPGIFSDPRALLKVIAITVVAAGLSCAAQSGMSTLINNSMLPELGGYVASENIQIATYSNTRMTMILSRLSGLPSLLCSIAVIGTVIWQHMKCKEKFE